MTMFKFLLMLLIFFWVVVVGAQGITPLEKVIERNWTRWSGGKETVTKTDLIVALGNPDYRDEDAAALVTLETFIRKIGAVDHSGAVAEKEEKYRKMYQDNVQKLRSTKRVLFAGGRPDFAQLQQGPGGDCYFFAGTGWMALNRPEVIVEAIRPLADGMYQVVFPNGEEATVAAPTDAELAYNDSTATLQDGLWMAVLEKATGVIQQRHYPKSAAIPDPTAAIDVPGIPPASIVKRWSGRSVRGFHLGRVAHRDKIRHALIRMAERREMAEVLLLKKPAARLMYDHVYAVLGFNAENDMLKIWNPHGHDFTPESPAGPENGYATRHGIFYISLDEFIEFFTFLTIEEK